MDGTPFQGELWQDQEGEIIRSPSTQHPFSMPLPEPDPASPAICGEEMACAGGRRLYLLKQCNLIIELLGREWPDPPLQSLAASGNVTSALQGATEAW